MTSCSILKTKNFLAEVLRGENGQIELQDPCPGFVHERCGSEAPRILFETSKSSLKDGVPLLNGSPQLRKKLEGSLRTH